MITTEKDFGKAVLRVWEIGDLIPRVVEQLSNPSPLRNRAKDCEMLISLGKELCELSKSIPFPGQRMICKNGMINTEAENANYDDIDCHPDYDANTDSIKRDVESITDVHAQEIDAMSEDEIDSSVPDSGVERALKMIQISDLEASIMRNTQIFKAGMKAQKELDK